MDIQPRIRLGRGIFYVITIIAILLVYWKFSELEYIKAIVSSAGRGWLLAAALSQLMVYYFLALNYREVLRMKGLTISQRTLFPITFIIQFIQQAVPTAGLSGQIFFIYYLKKYGLTVAEGMARAILEVMTLYSAYSATFVLAVILLFRNGILERFPLIWIFVYVFVFFFCIAVFAFVAIQKKRRIAWVNWVVLWLYRAFEESPLSKVKRIAMISDHTSDISRIIDECKNALDIDFLKHHKKLFSLATFWQFMFLFVNVFTLYFIGFAINSPIPFTVAFVVFTLSKLISMTSFIPGSFGIFEAGMVAVLYSFGIQPGAGLAMTVIFRAFTFWLPMPVGWVLYGRYMRQKEAEPATEIGRVTV